MTSEAYTASIFKTERKGSIKGNPFKSSTVQPITRGAFYVRYKRGQAKLPYLLSQSMKEKAIKF